MTTLSEVTLQEFQSKLTDAHIKTLQIIQAALGVGVTAFLGVVVFLYTAQPEYDQRMADQNLDLIKILTLIHALMAATLYYGSTFIYNMQFTESKLREAVSKTFNDEKGQPITDPVFKCMVVIRTAMILRLAMLESSALFGLVICLLAVTNGVMHHYPEYWLNLITAALFLSLVVMLFPNRERIEGIFVNKIAQGSVTQ
ncbi:ATP synthase F0 subunit C [bacterium]|nr:ATP synthase F0 subunit C [bacterium]